MASSRLGESRAIPRAEGVSNHSAPRKASPGRAATAGPQEVILQGRRYRLVPLDEGPPPEPDLSAVSVLTGRELQIVMLVAEGRVNKQIAGVLHISEWTVSTHLRRVFAKLGVETRAAMVSRCADVLVKRGVKD